ncbi:MAG: YceD family protein [Prevotella sp.]|jgi:uncharacterized metal-binding protein YceD (DUF177 family)
MSCSDTFKFDLNALPQGITRKELVEDDAYFATLSDAEVKAGDLKTTVTINRVGDVFELDFHTEGYVIIPCDICLDDMQQDIATDNHLLVKFGDDYSEEDEVITVAENEGMLDTAWLVYQFIYLSIPLRHVHAPGKCNPAMTKLLQEHSAARSGDGDGEKMMDSRWEALKNLHLTD